MGRVLTPGDDQPLSGQPVMVLSHRGWDRLFARDPNVVGRRLPAFIRLQLLARIEHAPLIAAPLLFLAFQALQQPQLHQ